MDQEETERSNGETTFQIVTTDVTSVQQRFRLFWMQRSARPWWRW